jgi:PEGA domain
MRIAITLALLAALGSPAHAGDDVGVIVTGEGSLQPQLTAQIESWLSQHGHKLVASPLPPDAITALVDCFVMQDSSCARGVVEQRATSTSMVFARLDTKDNASNGTRDVTLTAYWFDKGHEAISQSKTCQRCTDQSLRTTADEIMKKLVGGGDVGHLKIKSTPPGAKIIIDGQAIGVTPLDWDLPSGKHTIQMDKAGLKSETRDVLVLSNKTDLFAMKLVPASEESHGEEQPLPRIIPIGMAAVGGALLVAGGLMIYYDQDPVPSAPPTIHNTGPAGAALMISGAVVGGAGAAWLLFRSPKATSAPVAAVTRDSAYIGWGGRF